MRVDSTRSLALILSKLRIKLLSASMGPTGRAFYALGGIGILTVSASLAAVVAFSRGHAIAPTAIALGATAVAMLWTAGSIAVGSGQHVFDPKRLLLLPIERDRLMTAYLVSSLLTFTAMGTLIVSLAPLTNATGVVSALLLLVAGPCQWLTAVLAGRTAIEALNSMLGGRRSKELATFITVITAMFLGISVQALSLVVASWNTRWDLVRSYTRWLPWSWAGEAAALAIEGDVGLSLGWLLISLSLTGFLYLGWSRLTVRNLQVRPDNTPSKAGQSVIFGPLRLLSPTPVVVAWSRALRQLRRDVRELIEMASLAPLAIIGGLPLIGLDLSNRPGAVLLAAGFGAATTLPGTNLFGADGPNVGVDGLTLPSIKPVLVGKALARASVVSVPVIAVLLAICASSNGWHNLPAAGLVAFATLTGGSAVGMFVSTRAPTPLPEAGAFGVPPGQSQAVGWRIGALFVSAAATSAFVLIVSATNAFWPRAALIVAACGAVVAVGLFSVTAKLMAAEIDRNLPEFIAKVTIGERA